MEISPLIIFLAAIFTSNILLTNFLGMCSYLSVSRQIESSFGLGLAVFSLPLRSFPDYHKDKLLFSPDLLYNHLSILG